jgi:hypothetical protein
MLHLLHLHGRGWCIAHSKFNSEFNAFQYAQPDTVEYTQ